MLLAEPGLGPRRPEGCMPTTLSDAGMLAMAATSALPGFRFGRRRLRYASTRLGYPFLRQIGQSGWNKRLRKKTSLLMVVIRQLGMDTALWAGDVWIADPTLVAVRLLPRDCHAQRRCLVGAVRLLRVSLPVALVVRQPDLRASPLR